MTRIPINGLGAEEETCPAAENETAPEPRKAGPEAENPAPAGVAAESKEEDWKARYLRLQADFENFRRHALAERERLIGLGKDAALEDIFPLVDHLERGLSWARDHQADPAVIEGLELVRKELLKVLEKHGVRRMETLGQQFDPSRHQAVTTLAHPTAAEGEIIAELQAGFLRGDKLLRPAQVVVAQ